MIVFKSHRSAEGFSLIEVALALVTLGMVLSVVLMLQHTVLEGVHGFSNRLVQIFLLKQRLSDAAYGRFSKGFYTEIKENKEKVIGKATIIYEQKKPSKNSALEKFNTLKIEKATSQWKEWDGLYSESLITFLYKPEQKKS